MINEEIIKSTLESGGEKAVADLLKRLPEEDVRQGLGIVATIIVMGLVTGFGYKALETIVKLVNSK